MKKQLKMYVWEDVLTDYTSGMVAILAEDLEQAKEIAEKIDPTYRVCKYCRSVHHRLKTSIGDHWVVSGEGCKRCRRFV